MALVRDVSPPELLSWAHCWVCAVAMAKQCWAFVTGRAVARCSPCAVMTAKRYLVSVTESAMTVRYWIFVKMQGTSLGREICAEG